MCRLYVHGRELLTKHLVQQQLESDAKDFHLKYFSKVCCWGFCVLICYMGLTFCDLFIIAISSHSFFVSARHHRYTVLEKVGISFDFLIRLQIFQLTDFHEFLVHFSHITCYSLRTKDNWISTVLNDESFVTSIMKNSVVSLIYLYGWMNENGWERKWREIERKLMENVNLWRVMNFFCDDF